MQKIRPISLQKDVHWSRLFTERLNEDVKLVGSTISCEAAYKDGNFSNVARHIAHVQSYIMATDQVWNDSHFPYNEIRMQCRGLPKTRRYQLLLHMSIIVMDMSSDAKRTASKDWQTSLHV